MKLTNFESRIQQLGNGRGRNEQPRVRDAILDRMKDQSLDRNVTALKLCYLSDYDGGHGAIPFCRIGTFQKSVA